MQISMQLQFQYQINSETKYLGSSQMDMESRLKLTDLTFLFQFIVMVQRCDKLIYFKGNIPYKQASKVVGMYVKFQPISISDENLYF